MFDLHNDYPTALPISEYSRYLSTECRNNTVVAVIYTTEFDTRRAIDNVRAITNALSDKKVANIAIEDVGFLRGDDEIDFGKYLYCSLTWNFNNRFAGGALDDGSLTRDGRTIITEINGKCALDLAHINKRSFYSALDLAQDPICSHTGFGKHPRCLDDDRIRALVERKAPIGLCAVRKFTEAYTAKELAAVIDKFVQRYGIDCLCMGTDFNGSTDLPEDFKSYADLRNLENALLALGYGSADIDRIFYTNAYTFFKELKS